MLKSVKFDIVWYMLVVAAFCAITGCGKKEPQVVENDKLAVEQKTTETDAVEKTEETEATNRYPQVVLPPHLEETKDMPSGMAKSRAVQRKYIETRLKELQTQLQENSEAVGKAEKKARIEDPKLGKLYKELVDKQIEYRTALAESESFAAAKEPNMETLKMYQMLTERRKFLINQEKTNDK